MILDVDMFHTSIMFQIVSEGDSALVVTIDDVLIADVIADFVEKAEEPDVLLKCMEKNYVFGFHAGEGDCHLLL